MSEKIRFKPPQALISMTEEAGAAGKDFELISKFRQEGEMWCLVEIEGIPLAGYKEKESTNKFSQTYQSTMAQPPAQEEGAA